MTLRRTIVSVGVGGTAFLLASVVGFEVFGGDFPSVFYVLPIALLAAVVAAGGGYRVLRPTPGQLAQSGLTGVAAFSYSFFLLWFLRYSIAATRPFLSFDLIAILSAVAAVAVAVAAWISHPVSDGY